MTTKSKALSILATKPTTQYELAHNLGISRDHAKVVVNELVHQRLVKNVGRVMIPPPPRHNPRWFHQRHKLWAVVKEDQ